MKNKYKINEILDAVNVILNQKDNVTEKKEEAVLRPVDEIKENKVDFSSAKNSLFDIKIIEKIWKKL